MLKLVEIVTFFSRIFNKECTLFAAPWTVAHRLLSSWDSPGKNTGVGCHFLRQGILPTQGENPGILHCKQILYHLSHKEAQ